MAYTYDQLTTAIQEFTENDEATFVSNIPNFIRNCEDLIFNSMDLDYFRKNATATCSVSNQYLAKPTDYISPFALQVVDSADSNRRNFLMLKDVAFIQEVNQLGSTGLPRFYAPFDVSSFILAPVPNLAYSVELHYYYRPTSLTEAGGTGTTWLSTNAPLCMLYGSLMEAYTFMKGEQDVMGYYKEQFVNAMSRLKDLAEAKENADAYRYNLPMRPRT